MSPCSCTTFLFANSGLIVFTEERNFVSGGSPGHCPPPPTLPTILSEGFRKVFMFDLRYSVELNIHLTRIYQGKWTFSPGNSYMIVLIL